MKTGIVIQARMGSTRLPGKVLKPLPVDGDMAALDWTIRACLQTGYQVIVATSTNPEDDAIADRFSHADVPVFRGDATDVLDRVYRCAEFYGLDEIIRITGDCPFVDPDVIRQVVELRRWKGADYASNVDPPTWPDGLDVQVVTMPALHLAWLSAKVPTDRDTVLQYIVRSPHLFDIANLPCPFPGMERRRWVLDTAADYETCCRIAMELMKRGITVPRLADLLDIGAGAAQAPDGSRNERYLAARAPELKANGFGISAAALENALNYQPYGASTYSKSHVAWGKNAPLYTTHAQGSRVFDVDSNEYIDFTGGLGTTILGHADPGIRDAIVAQLDRGIASPLAHDLESHVARNIIDRVIPALPPGAAANIYDQWKLVFGKNGSDVTSAAVRVARVFTGRPTIAIVATGYHGWHDWAVEYTPRGHGSSGLDIVRVSKSALLNSGIPNTFAATIMEPDQFTPEEIAKLIDSNRMSGSLVIFDEMVTAFRYPKVTYAATYGLDPDLICLGKALGNGMPITALIGRAEIMDKFVTDPSTIGVGGSGSGGEPYAFYSGTHFGEGLSLAAANTVMRRMDDATQSEIVSRAKRINVIVAGAVSYHGMAITVGPPPLSRLTFGTPDIAAQFRREMARNGVLVYSAFFAMLAHSDADLEHLAVALDRTFVAIKNGTARGGETAPSGIMRS